MRKIVSLAKSEDGLEKPLFTVSDEYSSKKRTGARARFIDDLKKIRETSRSPDEKSAEEYHKMIDLHHKKLQKHQWSPQRAAKSLQDALKQFKLFVDPSSLAALSSLADGPSLSAILKKTTGISAAELQSEEVLLKALIKIQNLKLLKKPALQFDLNLNLTQFAIQEFYYQAVILDKKNPSELFQKLTDSVSTTVSDLIHRSIF